MDNPRSTLMQRALKTGRGALVPIGLFSLIFNLLALVVPLYMMQVYDRVLASGSLATLLWLTLLALATLLAMVLLDVSRSIIGLRVSGWLDAELAPQAFDQAIATAVQQRSYNAEALRDLAALRGFLGGPTLFVLFDALWAPDMY
jgi:ABC-type protease/lipase transport system fused ATPase/permease subunit